MSNRRWEERDEAQTKQEHFDNQHQHWFWCSNCHGPSYGITCTCEESVPQSKSELNLALKKALVETQQRLEKMCLPPL